MRHDPARSDDRTNVPADRHGWFEPEPTTVDYPGGNFIFAQKQLPGDRLLSIVLHYRPDGGNMAISCSGGTGGRHISLDVMTGTLVPPDRARLRLSSGRAETTVVALVVPSQGEIIDTTTRSIRIDGAEMDAAISLWHPSCFRRGSRSPSLIKQVNGIRST